jgi:hypothetical protein
MQHGEYNGVVRQWRRALNPTASGTRIVEDAATRRRYPT